MIRGITNNPVITDNNDIRGILVSLYYLAKEAQTAELTEISRIIRHALHRTEEWASGNGGNICTLVSNEDTFLVLEFFNQFIGAPTEARKDFLEVIAAVFSKQAADLSPSSAEECRRD